MAKVTYDANIFIKYKERSFPRGLYMSAVVLQELLAGAKDASAIKELERVRHEYRRANKLLVPTEEDWWHVGLLLMLCNVVADQRKRAGYRRSQRRKGFESSTMF